jgi:hypothetical protein
MGFEVFTAMVMKNMLPPSSGFSKMKADSKQRYLAQLIGS